MKKILHTIYTGLGAVVATALMLVGCIDDDLVKTNDVVEGVPITVNLTLSGAPVADVTVETKASGSDLSDVGDLVVFIFRNDGTFESVATNYNGSTSLKIVSSKVENGNRLYNVSFSTTSGTKKMLALANIADGGYWEGIIDQLTDGYNSKISFDDLKKMVVNLDSDLIAASKTSDGTPPFHVAGESQMLISGWNEGIVFDTSGQVTDNGTYGIERSTVILQMRRAMAHINFEIAANPDGAKGTFTPTSYRVYNIPTKNYAINDLQGVTALKLTTNITDVEYIHTASENIGVAQGENILSTSICRRMCNRPVAELLHTPIARSGMRKVRVQVVLQPPQRIGIVPRSIALLSSSVEHTKEAVMKAGLIMLSPM